MTTIERVEAWTVQLPMRRPVIFAAARYDARDYTIVRLTTSDGCPGFAYCLARNAPLAATVRALAPLVMGEPLWQGRHLWDRLYAASIPFGQRGLALRAVSLLDVALWDAKGRAVSQPVHALLGSTTTELRFSVGGGYFRDARSADDVTEELAGYVSDGFGLVKIPAGGLDRAEEQRWVEAARSAIGADVELAVDAHWTWNSVQAAAEVLAPLDDCRLAWVEDPLWPESIREMARLASLVRSPLGVGDEISGRWAFRDLAETRCVDIWRVDVMTVGGFTEFQRISALAETYGATVNTHVYAELHAHAAAHSSAVRWTEYVAPEADIDLSYRFIDQPLRPVDGRGEVPNAAGLGFELDWDFIEGHASEHWGLTRDG